MTLKPSLGPLIRSNPWRTHWYHDITEYMCCKLLYFSTDSWIVQAVMLPWGNFCQKRQRLNTDWSIVAPVCCVLLEAGWNVMAHALKPDFVFRQNGRVNLNRWGHQFSRLLAAEICTSAVVMLDTPCSEVVWRVLATHFIRQFPPSLPLLCVTVWCHHISTGVYHTAVMSATTNNCDCTAMLCSLTYLIIQFVFVRERNKPA